MAKKTLEPLQWETVKVKLSDLKDYEHNPRVMRDTQLLELHKSLEKFGYVDMISADHDLTIIGGHQRKRILTEQGKADEEVEIRKPNRKLTKEEFVELNIRLNRGGNFDFQKAIEANTVSVDDLLSMGIQKMELGMLTPVPGKTITPQYNEPAKPSAPGGDGESNSAGKTPDNIPNSDAFTGNKGILPLEERLVPLDLELPKKLRDELYKHLNEIKEEGQTLSEAFQGMIEGYLHE